MNDAPSPVAPKVWTAEEFLAIPDDGVFRELINGQIWEEGVTYRNRHHSGVEATVARLLGNWAATTLPPRGRVHSGEAGFRLRRDPDSIVGIDVAYASAELVAASDFTDLIYDGAPVVAVEILSPSDQQGKVAEKVKLYLEAGTVVWVVNPDFQTVTVHRRGSPVLALGMGQELEGGPELPGFRAPVAALFE